MSKISARADVVPACLSFLTIYNPTLNNSDQNVHEQIVYYYTKDEYLRRERNGSIIRGSDEVRDVLNEKLRQVGLAQGILQFARDFSNGEDVDVIETEKSRIILHNLEGAWWLLASIDLTRIPNPPDVQAKGEHDYASSATDYSAREVAQPALLLQQLLRAHRIFLLHQAPSLTELWTKVSRQKFCAFLKRFWDNFVWNWDVILHGSPAVDIFNGLKLSAGGELGVGAEEEVWGSGEREILEGFVDKTDGLVDLLVSRFGAPFHGASKPNLQSKPSGGYGAGEYPDPSDGVIFSGKRVLTSSSARDISSWMEWLYMYGETAYGVKTNPSSLRRKRFKRENPSNPARKPTTDDSIPPGIPPPVVQPTRAQRRKGGGLLNSEDRLSEKPQLAQAEPGEEQLATGTDTFVKYLTLGMYGSQWGIPSGRPLVNERLSNLRDDKAKPQPRNHGRSSSELGQEASSGHFMLGLLGQLEEKTREDTVIQDTDADSEREATSDGGSVDSRIVMRTVHVERRRTNQAEVGQGMIGTVEEPFFDKLRVVVYVQEPFMFTFLFELGTDSLALPSFYRSLHHQLGPLQGPLLISTSPGKVSERLWEAASPRSTNTSKSMQPISDLVYDPIRLTVHTTIPNIPETIHGLAPTSVVWTRAEAVMVHSQILNTYNSTRCHGLELERTCKTSRGWWIVWMRLPHACIGSHIHSSSFREAFLIRKASDYVAPSQRLSNSRYTSSSSTDNTGWSSPGKLAEGIGIDARQYVEGLLSLNR